MRTTRTAVLTALLALVAGLLGIVGLAPPRPPPTAPASAPRGWSPSATPTSAARPAAGPAAATPPAAGPTRSAPRRTSTTPSGTGEQINRCHRSKSAEAYIGGGVNGLNLACSGATTATSNGDNFKPGLDFYDNGAGQIGQAKALQQFAATHNVKMVVVSIGGNDFNFASIVQSCVVDFLTSPTWWKDYCKDDSSVVSQLHRRQRRRGAGPDRRRLPQRPDRDAQRRLHRHVRGRCWCRPTRRRSRAATASATPRAATRGSRTGGCGFWNADADWANDYALPTINNAVSGAIADSGLPNAKKLDLSAAFNGRRLCENTVGLYEERGIANWTSPGAVDQTEWVNQIRTVSTCCGSGSPYYIQESLHPNYWAQLATRSCVRQAYNGGATRGGSCRISGTGLVNGEPRMVLQ